MTQVSAADTGGRQDAATQDAALYAHACVAPHPTQGHPKTMKMDRYHRDHSNILDQIEALRSLSRAGVGENGEEIAQCIVNTASLIKFHLAAEDQVLYPRLATSGVPEVEQLSTRYQDEMQGLAEAFGEFVVRWRVPARLRADPDGFRNDANTVLKALYERLQREDRELYPAAAQL